LTERKGKGLDLPERVRKSLAAAIADRGVQARVISTQGRESMRPPQGHIIIAAEREEVEAVRGPARIVRRLEFYKTFYGPVVRLALSVYPMEGEPLSAGTALNVSQVSDDLTYAFSKEIPNATEQRGETKKVHKMARDAYTETPEERRSFRSAVGLAESQFELPVPEPDEEG
jgi:hypothetical protein